MNKIEIAYSRDLATWESQHFDYAMVIEIILPEPGSWYVRARHYNDTESSLWSNSTLFNLPAGTAPVLTINYDSSPESLQWTAGGMVYDVYYKGQGGLPPFRPLIIGTTDLSYVIGGQIAENGNVFKVNAITGGIAMQSNEETYQKAVPTNTLDHVAFDVTSNPVSASNLVLDTTLPWPVFVKHTAVRITIPECSLQNVSGKQLKYCILKITGENIQSATSGSSILSNYNIQFKALVPNASSLTLAHFPTTDITFTTNTTNPAFTQYLRGTLTFYASDNTVANVTGTFILNFEYTTDNLVQTVLCDMDLNVTSPTTGIPISAPIPWSGTCFYTLDMTGEWCEGNTSSATKLTAVYNNRQSAALTIKMPKNLMKNTCVTYTSADIINSIYTFPAAVTPTEWVAYATSTLSPATLVKASGHFKLIGVA